MKQVLRYGSFIIFFAAFLSCKSVFDIPSPATDPYGGTRIKIEEKTDRLHLRIDSRNGIIESVSGNWDQIPFSIDFDELIREYRIDSVSRDGRYCYISSLSKRECWKISCPETACEAHIEDDWSESVENYSHYTKFWWHPVSSFWQRVFYSLFPISSSWISYFDGLEGYPWKQVFNYISSNSFCYWGQYLKPYRPFFYKSSKSFGGAYLIDRRSGYSHIRFSRNPPDDTLNFFRAFCFLGTVDTSSLEIIAQDEDGTLFELKQDDFKCYVSVHNNQVFLGGGSQVEDSEPYSRPYDPLVIANLRHLLDENDIWTRPR